jgi:hypothetical protein
VEITGWMADKRVWLARRRGVVMMVGKERKAISVREMITLESILIRFFDMAEQAESDIVGAEYEIKTTSNGWDSLCSSL